MSVEGYCWPLSVAPGGSISFMVSGNGHGTVTFARHRSLSEKVETIVLGERPFVAETRDVPREPWRNGCGWPVTIRHTVPVDWTSGIHSASFVDSVGDKGTITFVVRAEQRPRMAVLANVNTWLAYNEWGGRSKYGGAALTSFLRPNPAASPYENTHLARGELWVTSWLERERFQYDLLTDVDFHNEGLDPAQYWCLILSTHPEYWTPQAYDRLQSYLAAGGSLVYLGGNGVFESGEYTADQTGVVFRLGVEGGRREPAMFRLLSPPRHERGILGVATERSGVTGGAYVVEDGQSHHWAFRETGLRDGDHFGDEGFNYEGFSPSGNKYGFGNGKASGWEVDTCDGPGAVGLPGASELDGRPVPPSRLPDGVLRLARGEAEGELLGADMALYHHAGGGLVFSTGSLTFGGSLVVDRALSQIVRNVLTRIGFSELFLAWNGVGEDSRLFCNSGPDGRSWTDQAQIGGDSSHAPALAAFGGRLTVAWKGVGDDPRIFYNSSSDGRQWTDQVQVGGGTSHGPALAPFRDRIYLTWKGVGDDPRIFYNSSSDGRQWTDQVQVGGGTSHSPTLAAFQGRLYLAWKGVGDDPRMFFNSSHDGGQWTDQFQVGGGTSHGPVLAPFPPTS